MIAALGDAPTVDQLWDVAAPMVQFLAVIAGVLLAISILRSI